jgi:hypothetical protein
VVETGKLENKVWSSGIYFFVIQNPKAQSTELIYSQGTGSKTMRVTLAQIIKSYWHTSEETEALPFLKSIRETPGTGSNS